MLIALDFEFNQHFPFPGDRPGKGSDLRCPAEIVQIGAARLDDALSPADTCSLYIRPTIYRRMHPHIKRLTGITTAALRECPTFPDALEAFRSFASKGDDEAVYCVWGKDDIKELFRNVMYHGKDVSAVSAKYINVQQLANKYLENPNTAIGLKAAAEALGLETARPFHDALSDALYTGEILNEIIRREREVGEEVSKILEPQTYDPSMIKLAYAALMNNINVAPMFAYARKKAGHELTEQERVMVMAIYNAGRVGKFDAKRDKERKSKEVGKDIGKEAENDGENGGID